MNIPTNMKKNELFFFLNNESPFPNSELDDAAGQKKKTVSDLHTTFPSQFTVQQLQNAKYVSILYYFRF